MVETVRLLVVEDNEDQLQLYRDAAKEREKDGLQIDLVERRSAAKAKEELLSGGFDGAIIDLNLSPGDPSEASGNEVLLDVTERHRFPVLVVSGNLQNLDDRVKRSSFMRTVERDTPNEEIFDYLLKVYSTGITKILGGRGLIEEQLGEIFWGHLARDFEKWDAGDRDSERTLLRYTVSHLSEYLDTPSEQDKRYYHEAEFYIVPPIRSTIATGDIVRLDNTCYLVLSPPCDVVVREELDGRPVINAKSIILAPLVPVSREEFVNCGLIREGGNDDHPKGRERLLDELIKGKREKYVFLPGYRDMTPAVADLQNLCAWSLNAFLQAERLATVSGAFLKDIQSRFAAYYGRQGQPDLDKRGLVKKYKASLAPPE